MKKGGRLGKNVILQVQPLEGLGSSQNITTLFKQEAELCRADEKVEMNFHPTEPNSHLRLRS
jgi:hypothetical protein